MRRRLKPFDARLSKAPRQPLRRASGLIALVLAVWVGGCAQSDAPPLPDLASKQQSTGPQPLSTAEQKKAIDALAAKRDAASAEPKR